MQRIVIESLNSTAAGADSQIDARQFVQLAERMSIGKESLAIDIGGSNIASVLAQMAAMEGTADDIDWWLIPCDDRSKVLDDTVATVDYLINELGVEAEQIVVVANGVEFPKEFNQKFAAVLVAAERSGFSFSKVGIVKSDLFDAIKDTDTTILEMAADETDLKGIIREETDEENLAALGRQLVQRRMAISVSRNLHAVWAATPIAAALKRVEELA